MQSHSHVRTRHRMVLCALISLILMLTAMPAHAAQTSVTITDVYPLDVQTTDYGTRPLGYRADGQVAYCAQGYLSAPRPGDAYTSPRTVEGTALDYVVYHGYDGKAVTELYGARGDHAEMATAAAVWIVRGDAEGNQQWRRRWEGLREQDIKDAAKRLADEAKAWEAAGGRGPERGSAVIYDYAAKQTQQDIVMKRPRVRIALTKKSSNPSISDNNPCYSLAGAVYGVYRDEACAQEVGRMATDAAGRASLDGLAPGTYYVKEITPAKGYALDEATHAVNAASDAHLDVSDAPQNDPARVVVQKLDAETGKASPLGAGTLAGAEFTLRYYAGLYDSVDALPEAPTRTWVIKTNENGVSGLDLAHTNKKDYFVSGDDFYETIVFGKPRPTLPLGTLTVQETKAPDGYTLTDATVHLRKITSEGYAEPVQTFVAPEIKEQVIRGDFDLTKVSAPSMKRLSGVPFLVTSKTTGESHVVVTDKNGYLSTAAGWNAHSAKTNANDSAWDGRAIDSAKLDPSAGVWFAGSKDWASNPDDKLGALPYDTYEVRELEVSSNKGHDLVTFEIKIERNNVTVGAGTVDNEQVPPATPPAIQTTARDAADGDKTIRADARQRIVDTVSYTGLTPGKTYTVTGTLMDKETGMGLTDKDGKPITSTREFVPGTADGAVDITFEFDNTGREGKATVVFERLERDGKPVATHADINDEGQTVHTPGIKTTATDMNGEKELEATEKVTIVDTVSYTGLTPGKTYTVTGTLMDKETGKELTDKDGKPITSTREFVPEKADGVVTTTFELEGELVAGKKIVVFERVERDGKLVAAHADINDEGQTVTFKPATPAPASPLPQTGDVAAGLGIAITAAAAVAIGGGMRLGAKKNRS